MAPPVASQILFALSGKSLTSLGTLPWRKSPPQRGGEIPYTFARADATTCATYIDYDGILRYALANVPRIEWVDLDGDGIRETPGLLLEGSRANGWTQSEAFENAAWTTDATVTVTANGINGCDGTLSADRIQENSANSGHYVRRAPPTMTTSTRQAVSLHVFRSTRSWCFIQTTDKGGTVRRTWFNLSTGVIGTKDAGHDAWISGAINNGSGNPARRCMLTFDSGIGAGAGDVTIGLATGDGVVNYTGDGASDLYYWGAQFEADKAFPSSYIKTVGSTVTRAADSFSLPFNFGPIDMSALVKIARPLHADATPDIGLSPELWRLSTAQGFIDVYLRSATRTVDARVLKNTSSDQTAAIPAGTSVSMLGQYKNLVTTPAVALDVGSGPSSFTTGAAAIPAFGNQTLGLTAAGNELYGVLIGLTIAKGLYSLSDMLAIPL